MGELDEAKQAAQQVQFNLTQKGTDFLGFSALKALLSAVGKPCVVNPDLTLRKAAKEADWPVMDYRA